MATTCCKPQDAKAPTNYLFCFQSSSQCPWTSIRHHSVSSPFRTAPSSSWSTNYLELVYFDFAALVVYRCITAHAIRTRRGRSARIYGPVRRRRDGHHCDNTRREWWAQFWSDGIPFKNRSRLGQMICMIYSLLMI